jgi:hypothetical protein
MEFTFIFLSLNKSNEETSTLKEKTHSAMAEVPKVQDKIA